MTYNFSLCFYTLFQSFRAQSIIGKCTSRNLFPYGGLISIPARAMGSWLPVALVAFATSTYTFNN